MIFSCFNGRRVVIKEYNTTFVWVLSAILLVATHVGRHEGPAALEALEAHLSYFVAALALAVVAYFTIRFLKKSGRVTA